VNYLFIGTVPTVLILWIGLIRRHMLDKELKFTALMTLITVLFSLGRTTPVFEWIFDHVPGVALYRRPADATFAFNVCLALIAGVCANIIYQEGLVRLRQLKWSKRWSLATAAMIMLVIALALAFSADQHHLPESLWALTLGGGAVIVVVAVLHLAHRTHRMPLAMMGMIALTGAELLWRNASTPLNAEPIAYYAPYAQLSAGEQAGLDLLRKAINAQHDMGQFPRVEILGLSGAWMNASMMLGLENTVGYNPLRIADYERAIGPGDNSGDITLRHFPESFRGYNSTLARMLGLEYLVLGKPVLKLPRHMPRPMASLLYASDARGADDGRSNTVNAGGMYIYKLRAPMPRVYFAVQAKPVDIQAAIEGEPLPDFDSTREVLMDDDTISHLKTTYSHNVADKDLDTKPVIRATHANSVLIEVDAEQTGLVVLHDIYYPGWRAYIDDQPVPVLRANILFRGVEVPAGHHLVRFDYQPVSIENLTAVLKSLLHR